MKKTKDNYKKTISTLKLFLKNMETPNMNEYSRGFLEGYNQCIRLFVKLIYGVKNEK